MKKTLVKSIKISFQEKTSKGFVDRSFDTPKEHLEWHLSQMQVGSNGVDASYVMTTSIMKINPQYFSIEALAAVGRNEVQLLKNLSEVLDEDLTLNELIINVFDKERMH